MLVEDVKRVKELVKEIELELGKEMGLGEK